MGGKLSVNGGLTRQKKTAHGRVGPWAILGNVAQRRAGRSTATSAVKRNRDQEMSPFLEQVRLMSTGNCPNPLVLLMVAVSVAVPPESEIRSPLYDQPGSRV